MWAVVVLILVPGGTLKQATIFQNAVYLKQKAVPAL